MGNDTHANAFDAKPHPLDCPVCGGFKHSHSQFCKECEEQRDTIEKRERQAKRDRHFGPLWPRG